MNNNRETLPADHDGLTAELDGTATTMWGEPGMRCTRNVQHEIVGSGRRYYCYGCGVWWDRARINKTSGEKT